MASLSRLVGCNPQSGEYASNYLMKLLPTEMQASSSYTANLLLFNAPPLLNSNESSALAKRFGGDDEGISLSDSQKNEIIKAILTRYPYYEEQPSMFAPNKIERNDLHKTTKRGEGDNENDEEEEDDTPITALHHIALNRALDASSVGFRQTDQDANSLTTSSSPISHFTFRTPFYPMYNLQLCEHVGREGLEKAQSFYFDQQLLPFFNKIKREIQTADEHSKKELASAASALESAEEAMKRAEAKKKAMEDDDLGFLMEDETEEKKESPEASHFKAQVQNYQSVQSKVFSDAISRRLTRLVEVYEPFERRLLMMASSVEATAAPGDSVEEREGGFGALMNLVARATADVDDGAVEDDALTVRLFRRGNKFDTATKEINDQDIIDFVADIQKEARDLIRDAAKIVKQIEGGAQSQSQAAAADSSSSAQAMTSGAPPPLSSSSAASSPAITASDADTKGSQNQAEMNMPPKAKTADMKEKADDSKSKANSDNTVSQPQPLKLPRPPPAPPTTSPTAGAKGRAAALGGNSNDNSKNPSPPSGGASNKIKPTPPSTPRATTSPSSSSAAAASSRIGGGSSATTAGAAAGGRGARTSAASAASSTATTPRGSTTTTPRQRATSSDPAAPPHPPHPPPPPPHCADLSHNKRFVEARELALSRRSQLTESQRWRAIEAQLRSVDYQFEVKKEFNLKTGKPRTPTTAVKQKRPEFNISVALDRKADGSLPERLLKTGHYASALAAREERRKERKKREREERKKAKQQLRIESGTTAATEPATAGDAKIDKEKLILPPIKKKRETQKDDTKGSLQNDTMKTTTTSHHRSRSNSSHTSRSSSSASVSSSSSSRSSRSTSAQLSSPSPASSPETKKDAKRKDDSTTPERGKVGDDENNQNTNDDKEGGGYASVSEDNYSSAFDSQSPARSDQQSDFSPAASPSKAAGEEEEEEEEQSKKETKANKSDGPRKRRSSVSSRSASSSSASSRSAGSRTPTPARSPTHE